MTTSPLDLPALREYAEAATPGPWEPADRDGWIGANRCYVVSSDEDSISDAGRPVRLVYNLPADAHHIAAFDPPTALALIDQAEAAMDGEHVADALAEKLEALIRQAIARAETAEKKVAKVRELATELRDTPPHHTTTGYALHMINGARATAMDILTALEGGA